MHDMTSPQIRAALANRIAKEYDEASVALFREDNRTHLGASVIGDPCEAAIWFGWRWIFNKNPGGRMYRLWQRGHREEPFVFDHLRKMGFVVNAFDPANGEQWRLSALHGHFGGSCDGRGFMPERFEYGYEIGFEVKTANDRQFKIARAKGVSLWKPKYARQMDMYGRAFGIHYFLFTVVNKNDDDTHFEIYECQPIEADRNLLKAERVILARSRPQRLSDHPSFADCRYCDFYNHCHKGAMAEKNCRSCSRSAPMPDKEWYCEHHKAIIPKHIIVAGCENWQSII